MKYQLQKGSHSVFSLHFHLIFVVKYRKKVLTGQISTRLKELVVEISTSFDVEIIEQETDRDHVLFFCTPKINLTQYIRSLKAKTALVLRKEFPQLYNYLWGNAFWSPSYFLSTTGQVSLDDVKKYVENQGKP